MEDDKRFYQAIDEVERIRQRILQKASATVNSNSSSSSNITMQTVPSVRNLIEACKDEQTNDPPGEPIFLFQKLNYS